MKQSGNPLRLFQISDSHCYASDNTRLSWTDQVVYPNLQLRAIRNHLANQSKGYSALIITGDLAQEEVAETYQGIDRLFSGFPLPVYALPGNHDLPEMMRANLGTNIQAPKSLAIGAWQLFFLDTPVLGQSHGTLNHAELEQLGERIKHLSQGQFVALFMHHHPTSIGSEWLDTQGLLESNSFWDQLKQWPQVKAIFHGHIHQEFEKRYQYADGRSVMVYGTPSTCIQVKPRLKTTAFEHTLPAWREIALHSDGKVEARVNYLSK